MAEHSPGPWDITAELLEACELAEKAIRLGIPQAAVQVIHEAGDYDALVLARIRLEEAITKATGAGMVLAARGEGVGPELAQAGGHPSVKRESHGIQP